MDDMLRLLHFKFQMEVTVSDPFGKFVQEH